MLLWCKYSRYIVKPPQAGHKQTVLVLHCMLATSIKVAWLDHLPDMVCLNVCKQLLFDSSFRVQELNHGVSTRWDERQNPRVEHGANCQPTISLYLLHR